MCISSNGTYGVRVGLIRLQLCVIRVLDENVTAAQLGRSSTAKVINHRDGCWLFCHLQESLLKKKI